MPVFASVFCLFVVVVLQKGEGCSVPILIPVKVVAAFVVRVVAALLVLFCHSIATISLLL